MAVIIPANFVFYFVRSNAEQALSTANIISCCLLISVSSFIIDFESHIMCWARGVYSTFCSYGQKYSIPLIKHSRKKNAKFAYSSDTAHVNIHFYILSPRTLINMDGTQIYYILSRSVRSIWIENWRIMLVCSLALSVLTNWELNTIVFNLFSHFVVVVVVVAVKCKRMYTMRYVDGW